MTQLSSVNQELVKVRPQSTELNLVIFQPRIIFQAQINDGSIARGARAITYDNVSTGSYSNIESGMTLLIGTTAGNDDIGRLRIRSGTASQLSVSENSNIAWADNQFLTGLRYFEVWPVFPRIIQSPSNPEEVEFFKDYDIPYTNQNSILGTFANAGPHRTVFLESNHTGTAYYSSTGTYNLLGHALTYNWAFEGGNPTGSTSANPGWIAYNTPGDYVTRLIVTDSVNGAVDTTYRYVSVRDKIGQGSHTPIVRWKMDELSGSRGEAGYQVQFTVFDTVSIDDNAVVMLHTDDYYGNTHASLGGNYPSGSNMFFVGHIDKNSIEYNFEYSFVKFTATSITGLMKQALGFSVSVNSVASPTKWYELLDMDVRRAIYHYLKWHTTVLSIADFEFKGTDYPIQYFDSDRESMFDAIDNLLRGTLVGQLTADRQNKLWAEVSAAAYSNPTGSFPSQYDITKRDWMKQPNIDERFTDDYSYIEMGGIQYSGVASGTFAPLIACAPGSAPSFRGKVEKTQGLALGSQTQLNQLVGNVFANRNSRYPAIQLDMTENLSNIDIAPQESNRITVSAEDNLNSNTPLDLLYLPDTITWRYYPQKKLILPSMTFKNLVTGIIGETIPVPAIADVDNGQNVPNISIPSIPPFIPTAGGTTMVWQAQTALGLPQGPINFSTVNFTQGTHVTYGASTGTSTITLNYTGVYELVAEVFSIEAGLAKEAIEIDISGDNEGYDTHARQGVTGASTTERFAQVRWKYANANSTVVVRYADNSGGSVIITSAVRLTISYYPP